MSGGLIFSLEKQGSMPLFPISVCIVVFTHIPYSSNGHLVIACIIYGSIIFETCLQPGEVCCFC